jgi:O-antigen/teichoic acid export membrane protein
MTLNADDLGRRVVSGASFKLVGVAVRTLITLGSTAVLARLLRPADYGLIAMATVVTEFASLFSTVGMTDVLIQRRRISRIQMETVFWALLALGVALAAGVILTSFVADKLFGDARVAPLLRALAILFITNSLGSIPNVLMARTLQFKTEFYIGTSAMLIRSAAAIIAALSGAGIWSLVIGGITGSVVTSALGLWRFPFLPRLRYSHAYIKSSWRTSWKYLAGGLVYYFSMNIDLVLVGRNYGAATLGLYQNARSLADELRARIANPLAQTLFPAFSAIQSEPEKLRDLFTRSGRLLATIIFLFGAIISSGANEIVLILYGPKWIDMENMIILFGFAAAARGATALASPLLNASNRTGLVLKYHIAGTLIQTLALTLAIPHGISAASAATAVAASFSLVTYHAALRSFGMNLKDMSRMLGPPIIASGIAFIVATEFRPLVEQFTAIPRLGIISATVILTYASTLFLSGKPHVVDVAALIRRITRGQ